MEISKLTIKKLPLANNLSIDSQRSNYSDNKTIINKIKGKKDRDRSKLKKENSLKEKLLRSLNVVNITTSGQKSHQAAIDKEKLAQKKLFYQDLENSLQKTEDYVQNQVQAPYDVNFSDLALDCDHHGNANYQNKDSTSAAGKSICDMSKKELQSICKLDDMKFDLRELTTTCGDGKVPSSHQKEKDSSKKTNKRLKKPPIKTNSLKKKLSKLTDNYDAPLIEDTEDCIKLLSSVIKSIIYAVLIGLLIILLVNCVAHPEVFKKFFKLSTTKEDQGLKKQPIEASVNSEPKGLTTKVIDKFNKFKETIIMEIVSVPTQSGPLGSEDDLNSTKKLQNINPKLRAAKNYITELNKRNKRAIQANSVTGRQIDFAPYTSLEEKLFAEKEMLRPDWSRKSTAEKDKFSIIIKPRNAV